MTALLHLLVIACAGALPIALFLLVRARSAARKEAREWERRFVELDHRARTLQASNESLAEALESATSESQSKSQFLAGFSHELRTPLNAIIGFSELIAMEVYGPLGDARYREYIKDIYESGRNLLKLIGDILDFSRADAGKLDLCDDEIDVVELVSAVTRAMREEAARAEVKLVAEIPADLPRLRADERRTQQILANLLSNAIKFTPAGGEANVTAKPTSAGLAIIVADNGIGMAGEEIPRALRRFSEIDIRIGRKQEGVGLGLPLAKRLMEMQGGSLEIESTVRVGTKVTIVFPASRLIESAAAAA